MKCITCNVETSNGTTTDVTDLGKYLVIIRNVPCYKCSECNEIIYTGDVIKCLEKIVKSAEESMYNITVVDYSNIAA